MQPLKKETNENQYKVTIKFDLPEEMANPIKEELKKRILTFYTPIYAFYDYETNRIIEREEALELKKKFANSYFQFYHLKQTKTHLVLSRQGTKYDITYNSKTKEVNFLFELEDSPIYSYYAALPGSNKPSYFYNEKAKRKLMTENKFFSWSDNNIVYIDETILSDESIQKTAFDKLLNKVLSSRDETSVCRNLLTALKYFNYREKYPEIDNLIQKDIPSVLDLIADNQNLYNYFFKGNSFKKNFILPKGCLEAITENFCSDSYRLFNVLGVFNQLQFHSKNITKETIEELYRIYSRSPIRYDGGHNFLSNVKEIMVNHGIPLKQIMTYLVRVDDYQAVTSTEAIVLWKDYLIAAKNIGMQDFDRYPNSLKREHDVFIRESLRILDEREENDFIEAMDKYQELTYENDKYCIVVPKESEDLRREGRELSHCVGTYVSRVARKETTIFFVRNKKEKEMPLYTLEVSKGNLVQLKGKFNSKPVEDAFAFSRKFIDECINEYYDQGEVASLAM